MYDGIWFINSAIRVNQLSVYSAEERLEQTLKTLESIDKYCPNNYKFIFDGSPDGVYPYSDKLRAHPNTILVWTGHNTDVRNFGLHGQRSIAETISFINFLSWFRQMNYKSKRIYKLSGRYTLNDNFVLNDPVYEDSFVFADKEASWMPPERQKETGAEYLYKLRLWHMDFNLLQCFHETLPAILEDCWKYGIDVEHSYWKHLHRCGHVELDKIGVQGNIGPNGEFMEE